MSSKMMKENDAFLRTKMKEMLSLCTEGQQDLFRRMYDHSKKCQHPVDAIPSEKLDWAFQQIERTITNNDLKNVSESEKTGKRELLSK